MSERTVHRYLFHTWGLRCFLSKRQRYFQLVYALNIVKNKFRICLLTFSLRVFSHYRRYSPEHHIQKSFQFHFFATISITIQSECIPIKHAKKKTLIIRSVSLFTLFRCCLLHLFNRVHVVNGTENDRKIELTWGKSINHRDL